MRQYARIEPKAWQGDTFERLRAYGPEALLLAMYLMTSPHSNMMGLYKLPLMYVSEETGLDIDTLVTAFQACKDAGFCDFDSASKFVWVYEMARYQIGVKLQASDKQCIGVQREYDGLTNNPFLGAFFDRYAEAFHLSSRREYGDPRQGSLIGASDGASQAPPEPPSKQRERERKGERERTKPTASSAGKLPPCPYDLVIAAYHDVLCAEGTPELPKVRLVTASRKKAIQKVWEWTFTSRKTDNSPRATSAEEALAWFRTYFERALRNDFLMGRGKRSEEHANWRCDFDFLLTEKGMRHVIEKTQTNGGAA
jgi:hypothetical protein